METKKIEILRESASSELPQEVTQLNAEVTDYHYNIRENEKEDPIENKAIREYLSDIIRIRTHNIKEGEIVNALIREKYSIDEEFSLLRQKDTKENSYKEYYDYAEECKKIGSLAFASFKKNGIINE